MVIEAVDGQNADEFDAAMRELEAGIQRHCGGATTSTVLGRDMASTALED